MCAAGLQSPPHASGSSGGPVPGPALKDTRPAPDETGTIACGDCGGPNTADSAFCKQCGSRLKSATPAAPVQEPSKANVVAAASPAPVNPAPQPKTSAAGQGSFDCPKCHGRVLASDARCPHCGADMGMDHTIAMTSVRVTSQPRLVLVVDGEQTAEEFQLGNETLIGRKSGHITFPHDDYVSSRHVRIVKRGNSYILSDEGSRNGTFVKVDQELELKPGDLILVGRQLLRFEI